ncbi:glycosyltransferase family 4 protein [Halorubrum halophilum]|uniref:glycosyltransferase family 4 protein n=1 Tax=Halorubrum halophilum TaxID=413816 RepID=UPI00186AC579|nr:glycosyltransferase family 4 protein [Halorubrum halophilum]
MKVTLLEYSLSHNCLVRSHVLAQILQRNHQVEIAGPVNESGIWEPLADKYDYVPIETGSRIYQFPRSIPEFRERIDGDVLWARKPRGVSFGLGLVLRRLDDIPLLLDIEDWEAGLITANRSHPWLRAIPDLINCNSLYYTSLLESLTSWANGVTVSNTFLQSKFGGELIPHVRNEAVFDPERFNPAAAKEELGLPQDDFLITFIGTPRRHKGVHVIAEAIAELDRDDVRLLVVGTDESSYTKELRQIAGDRLITVGPQPFDDVPKWVSVADLVAVPQNGAEGISGQIPAKVFDAMAMGVPVIYTPISDLPEILDGCGVRIERDDPELLREAIIDLLDDPDRRHRLGQAGRRRFIRRYSVQSCIDTVERLLQTACE